MNDGNASAEEEIPKNEHFSESEIDVELTKKDELDYKNDTDKDVDDAQVGLGDEEHSNGDDDILKPLR